jgi:hypothetical protein
MPFLPLPRLTLLGPSSIDDAPRRATGVAVFAVASLLSVALAQQAGSGAGGGRKHHEQKTDADASTAPKADEKVYNAAIKNLPNKPYDPWSGTR